MCIYRFYLKRISFAYFDIYWWLLMLEIIMMTWAQCKWQLPTTRNAIHCTLNYTQSRSFVSFGFFSHFQLYCITFVDGKVRFFQNVTHSWTPAPIQNAFDVFISMKYICSVLFWCCVFWVGFCLGSFVIKNSSSSSSLYFCIRCQFEAI